LSVGYVFHALINHLLWSTAATLEANHVLIYLPVPKLSPSHSHREPHHHHALSIPLHYLQNPEQNTLSNTTLAATPTPHLPPPQSHKLPIPNRVYASPHANPHANPRMCKTRERKGRPFMGTELGPSPHLSHQRHVCYSCMCLASIDCSCITKPTAMVHLPLSAFPSYVLLVYVRSIKCIRTIVTVTARCVNPWKTIFFGGGGGMETLF
jgi:hypothetical protein